MDGGLKIGELARRTGVTAKAIRFYIVAIRQGGRPPCTHVHRLLRDKAVELYCELKDFVWRRIRQSLAAWKRRPVTHADAVSPHIETPAGRGRRQGQPQSLTGTLSPPSTARPREQPKRALDIPLRGKV